jgi:hypothetical protein
MSLASIKNQALEAGDIADTDKKKASDIGIGKHISIIFIILLFMMTIPSTGSAWFWDKTVPKVAKNAVKMSQKLKYGRSLSNIEMVMLKNAKIVSFNGRQVYTRKSIIDLNRGGLFRKSSCDLMKLGKAPIGLDGMKINLHHLGQSNKGSLLEILETKHQEHSSALHSHKTSSEIERTKFRGERKKYWKSRSVVLCNK